MCAALVSVLIVDDNLAMTRSLADILEVKGFVVHAANTGADALQILRDNPVDILLTDVKMPDMNGVSLYRQTRTTHPALTTILMTAYAADELIQQGLSEGIKAVLTKPLDVDFLLQLFSAIKRNLPTE
jgi:YesN/AraC family two-component response regulator